MSGGEEAWMKIILNGLIEFDRLSNNAHLINEHYWITIYTHMQKFKIFIFIYSWTGMDKFS